MKERLLDFLRVTFFSGGKPQQTKGRWKLDEFSGVHSVC